MDDPGSTDPFDPVEGVTLERYTELAVALYGVTADEEIETRAQAHGVPPGRFKAVAEGWNRRMAEHPEVVQRYSSLYQQALKDAGVEAPDITLEQYAEILRRQSQGQPVTEVLSDFGLDLRTFALVSQRWIDEMAADPSLAVRFVGLLQEPTSP
jgi:hypothetical protein